MKIISGGQTGVDRAALDPGRPHDRGRFGTTATAGHRRLVGA